MRRSNDDRLPGDRGHEITSKQRIVRRKVHGSASPPPSLSRSNHREVRTSGDGDLYPKMSHTHRSHDKYDIDFRHHNNMREDHLSNMSKEQHDHGYNSGSRHHDNLDDHEDIRGDGTRGVTVRKGNSIDGGGGTTHQSPLSLYHDKFEYSLHVANINSRLTDGEAKMNLFREFKQFGFVNIKVIGFGKDRHAFINFTRLDDAKAALVEMEAAPFFGQNLEVTWSRSTLNRYPNIMSGIHNERRSTGTSVGGGAGGGGMSKSRSSQNVLSLDFFNQGGGRNSDQYIDSPRRSSRDINYHNSSPGPPPPPSSRNHSIHVTPSEISGKGSAIVDPNATRTLFVGNLESDITERELRDLFSPYGRIESVDIKVQRSISTAYAFVKFFTITDAINAKTDMHGRKYGNTKLKIGFGKGSPSAKVWIGNLTTYADLSEIRSELDRFGLIRRVDYNNGENHAFVHFDSLEAAQTALSSLTNYRFRSTNRPLKIDLSQPINRSGSDFDEYDLDFYDPITSVSASGGGSARQVRTHISPEPLHPPQRGPGGGGGISNSNNFYRGLGRSDDEDDLEQHLGVKGSFRPGPRGRRVVTEVKDPAHSRHASHHNQGEVGYRGNYRKRSHSSPGQFDEIDMDDHGGRGRYRSDRGVSTSNGGGNHHHRGGGGQNGDLDYRAAKRPRNGFDAYQYHKLHGNRSNLSDRIGSSSSSIHGGNMPSEHDRERSYKDREYKDNRDTPRGGRSGGGGGGRGRGGGGGDIGGERRDRETRDGDRKYNRSSQRKSYRGNSGEGGADGSTRRDSRRTNTDSLSDQQSKNSSIEKVSPPPPPPPPPPPMMDIMAYEAADPALKLNDSTGPVSPTGTNGQLGGAKPGESKVECLSDMARVYPVVWHGNLVLKNTGFPTRMHLIGGDPAVAELLIRCRDPKEDSDSLRITQRLRLEPPRLEEVNKRMVSSGPSGHCILLALPGAIPNIPIEDDGGEVSTAAAAMAMQFRPLKSLVSYLEQKEAAGIVALNSIEVSGAQRENIIGVLHAFPPCEFSQSQLLKIAPNLGEEPAKEDHVVVLLVKGPV